MSTGIVTVLVSDGTNVLHLEPMGSVELEAIVDADITAFDECFQRELSNEPLVRSEIAILKTYLLWKTHPEKFNAPQESPAVPV